MPLLIQVIVFTLKLHSLPGLNVINVFFQSEQVDILGDTEWRFTRCQILQFILCYDALQTCCCSCHQLILLQKCKSLLVRGFALIQFTIFVGSMNDNLHVFSSCKMKPKILLLPFLRSSTD